MNLVTNKTGSALTTSKLIADSFGKIHRDVMRSIKNLDCSDEFRLRNFAQSYYVSPQNKKLECFEITRDGFAFLCMGFTGDKAASWKEKYIAAFNAMEVSISTIDDRMSELSVEQGKIKEAGKKWSEMGRTINRAKKENASLSLELVEEVQLKLGLEG